MAQDLFDPLPEFPPEVISNCRTTRRPMPVVWEVFRYVTILAVKIANLDPASPACRLQPRLHRAVTCGLANRCALLMGASMDMTTNARNRHALAIICRSITESATKLSWICQADTESRVRRFVADGLHADLEFRSMIESNIAARGGEPTAQEARMLRATATALRESGMTEAEIQSERALPNMYQMLQQLGYARGYYLGIQSIPSQAVHGNWSDLIQGYLCPDTEPIQPRTTHSVPNAGQYVGVALVVVSALTDYAGVIVDPDIAPELQSNLRSIKEWIHETYRDVCGYELEPEAASAAQLDDGAHESIEG